MELFNDKSVTLSDRLPYFGLDPKHHAIWLKDGSATLSLKIVPKDCSLLTDDDLETIRGGLTPILNHLPDGSVLQAMLMRERSKARSDEAYQNWISSHSGDKESSDSRTLLFDAKKQMLERDFANGAFFQTRCYLTLRVLPETNPKPGRAMGTFSHLAYWFQNKKASLRTRDQVIHDLTDAFETLSTGLSSLGFDVVHVPHEERMEIIYEWLNPTRSRALPAPKLESQKLLSDQVSLTDLVEAPTGLQLGRAGVEIASLKSLPEFSIPGAMQDLSCASIPFSLLVTIYVLPQAQEREKLLRKQRIAQGMASGNSVRNLMAEAQLRDIEDTLGALISSGEKLFGVSFYISELKEHE
jgi:hypothetical protein